MYEKRISITLAGLIILSALTLLYAADKPPVASIEILSYPAQDTLSKSSLLREVNTSPTMAGLPAEEKVKILAQELSKHHLSVPRSEKRDKNAGNKQSGAVPKVEH